MKAPKQARSQRTLDRIAVAARDLLAEGGTQAVTVAAVVERAGTSVGSFYARFGGKEEMILYLQERTRSEARERWDMAFGSQDWGDLTREAAVERVVGLLLGLAENDLGMTGVSGVPWSGRDGGLTPATCLHEHGLSSVTSLLMARRGEIAHPDPQQALRVGYWMVVGGILEALAWKSADSAARAEVDPVGPPVGATPDSPRGTAWQAEVALELARAWNAYLSWEVPLHGGLPERDADFFDPWG